MKRLLMALGLCAAWMLAGPVPADEITVSGHPYKNVLITKTESFYYVQVPEEGRTLSLPVAEVDASTVRINDDPFYRDPLKDEYAVNKARRASGEIKDVDPAFRAASAAGGGSGLSLDDLRGGGGDGGGAGGFGVPRTAIEATLAGMGFQFQPGPGNASAVATLPNGSLELLGPPESLKGVFVKASGPAQTVDASAQQLQLFVMQLRPKAVGAFTNAISEAKQKGSASVSAEGVAINITRKANGPNVEMEIRLMAEG